MKEIFSMKSSSCRLYTFYANNRGCCFERTRQATVPAFFLYWHYLHYLLTLITFLHIYIVSLLVGMMLIRRGLELLFVRLGNLCLSNFDVHSLIVALCTE